MLMSHVLNTKGAAKCLGCSVTWIHKLAATGKLPAYIYGENGTLVEHTPESRRQGHALYFFVEDVMKYQPALKRRPRGKPPMPPFS